MGVISPIDIGAFVKKTEEIKPPVFFGFSTGPLVYGQSSGNTHTNLTKGLNPNPFKP
ncbi:hypothetical protein P872_20135 [Rhodonellum psychrophilum GCM71 = DSM 17998]|uniref:Uncharacterized protein n=1 Tax=Rhodonellum psychrophilum GCM71 = DSM 17998 TaxID=1123057 RepID=U5BUP0_9BACT|nr:hypothetical protein P872_20135 [Rhodonellum psychrophilum GCM71 = DSM 17998]